LDKNTTTTHNTISSTSPHSLTSRGGTSTTVSSTLDCNLIASQFGGKAIPSGDICDVVVVRQSPQITDANGMVLNKFTLMSSVLEFTPATTNIANSTSTTPSGQQVFVMGDFALLESEVNSVLQVIVPSGWTVTGIHNHMIQETPKLSFMHWQVHGDLNTIISTAKQSLSKTTILNGGAATTTTPTTTSSIINGVKPSGSTTSSNTATSTPSQSSITTIHVSIVSNAPTMDGKAFQPNPINIKAGQTVEWTNNDSIAHTVTSGSSPNDPNSGKEFDSGPIAPHQTLRHTFNTAGQFSYHCNIHPAMTGQVDVTK